MLKKLNINSYLHDSIEKRKKEKCLRKLLPKQDLIDFCSNDYLGLSKQLCKIGEYDLGATGSRLISGNSALAEQTELEIAEFHRAEAALIFNCGYMANVGLISCIADKHTVILYDELIHASIIDGMRLSLAKRVKFKHNDTVDLVKKLNQINADKIIVIVESVYSMNGDLAPLKQIVEICSKYHAALIVDEAHATGLYGENGEGLVSELGIENLVWARVHTFGKALGLHGAVVVCSNLLKEYLINFSRTFIYTTALPPHLYPQIQQAYYLIKDKTQRQNLFVNIKYYTEHISKLNIPSVSFITNDSPIQSIIIPGNENVIEFGNYLQENGFFVKPILSPTVPIGTERVRICLHSFNTIEQINQLIESINNYLK